MEEVRYGAPKTPQPPTLIGFEHVNRYWDKTHGNYAAKILPGQFYVTRHEELITTVLGSCVSACIWDAEAGVGGMNHFMLPDDVGGTGTWGGLDASCASTRYGSHAMEQLINEILKCGGRRTKLRVKIFGGGHIIAQMTDIGRRNIAFVRTYLQTEGLQLIAEDLGGAYPRKVVFFPWDGRVRLKKLRSLHNETLLRREEAYLTDLKERPALGEVELF